MFATKNRVIIAKTKIKVYIFKTNFLLLNSLTNIFKALISKTCKQKHCVHTFALGKRLKESKNVLIKEGSNKQELKELVSLCIAGQSLA